MNYEETLIKIHSFNKFGSKLGLERMSILMNLLGNPQEKMKIIHVAGTNGKGSVCRYLTSVLKENGYRTGLYTSPYLERFTERIEFDGSEISHEDLISCAAEVFEKVDIMLKAGYESPTEFELVTAIGFVYFGRKPMDFLVLEVGLGGTGDSTNIIKNPLVSVITTISYDHMELLGDTLEKIAYEKAGIIKSGCPVVSNVKDPGAAVVIRQVAAERGCSFCDAAQIEIKDVHSSLDGYSFLADPITKGERIKIGMLGVHQAENAVCALAVLEVLEKKGIIALESEKLKKAMKKARQPGRLELLRRMPNIIIDGAHNEDGVKCLSRTVNELFAGQKKLLVIGMLADKDTDRLIAGFGEIQGDIAASEPDNPRKLGSEVLCRKIRKTGRDCMSVGDWQGACDYIKKSMPHYDTIIVSGSLYLIGRIRERFLNEA